MPCAACGGPRERVLLEAWRDAITCECRYPQTTLYVEAGGQSGLAHHGAPDAARQRLHRQVSQHFGLWCLPDFGVVEGERLVFVGCPFCLARQGFRIAAFAARAADCPAPTWQAWGWLCVVCGDWVTQEVRRDGLAAAYEAD